MTSFKRWNNITGWTVFAIAAVVYLMTMEPVSSLWDCSEFIATSYKLEVGHPPGAPLFMMLARLATLFAFGNPDYVGIAVNAMNSLSSAFCILFLFWTVTHLARRLVTRGGGSLSTANTVAILGAGAVGALAYTFTDTFWFSAIEGEVYALSSMFTALVVWLMLKWEEQADEPHASRWIILIAYLMGLSIGVHILNLLCIPALVFIYYFRKTEKVTWKGVVRTTLVAAALLIFINNIIIPYTVWVGAQIDTLFVNTFGLPVNSGMVVFALALILGLGWAAWKAHRKGRVVLNMLLLSTTMILVGYSSYASMTIRAAANPPMNSNNPNNPHALLSVLNRDQYGDRPLLYGAYYSAPPSGVKEKEIRYLGEDGKYKRATILKGYTHEPEFMHLFPRMWNSAKSERAYKEWAAYRTKTETLRDENGEIRRDAQGRPLRGEVLDYGRKRVYTDADGEPRTVVEPTFGENLNYLFSYQLSYMYWRYFMWNFVGRQSDIQPADSYPAISDGNWLSGIRWIDELYLGPQENLPREIAENKGRNTYYFLPLLLGLIGLFYQLNRDPRNFSIVMWLFIMMGVMLVFYFNTSPGEPRERDYVYAGSFYAFSIWIGLGVLALRDLLAWIARRNNVATAAAATVVALGVPALLARVFFDDAAVHLAVLRHAHDGLARARHVDAPNVAVRAYAHALEIFQNVVERALRAAVAYGAGNPAVGIEKGLVCHQVAGPADVKYARIGFLVQKRAHYRAVVAAALVGDISADARAAGVVFHGADYFEHVARSVEARVYGKLHIGVSLKVHEDVLDGSGGVEEPEAFAVGFNVDFRASEHDFGHGDAVHRFA